MSHSILVIDDEISMTNLLARHFKKENYLVYTANYEKMAYEGIMKNPDIILLDINMPDMDGIEFCKSVREHISCPIIFLTARVEENDKINGLLAGGDDYVTKPFSLKELSARVSAHLRREERQNDKKKVIAIDGILIDLTEKSVSYEGSEIIFSKTEFAILSYLALNRGYILDRERIYEAVWGYDAMGDSAVIKEHVRKIRKKLADKTGNELVETIWGMGYRIKG